jgi:hypothetical protein
MEDFAHLLATPEAGYEAILPWLTIHPEAPDGRGGIDSLYARQCDRLWVFRKSQWENRGVGKSEEGFPAFLESQIKTLRREGYYQDFTEDRFLENQRRYWQLTHAHRELPEDQGFPAYSEAVKRRLAPHHFSRPFQLKKDPRQQTAWVEWLEYINFEQWWLERLTANLERRVEEGHIKPWRRLLRAHSALVEETGPRRPGSKTLARPRGLEAAEAELDATKKALDDFVVDTMEYRQDETRVIYQKLRVKWAVKEARLMETEMSQRRKAAKGDTKINTKASKKRRRGDDEENPPAPRSKKAKRGDGGKSAVSDKPPGQPQTQTQTQPQPQPQARRSKRLAKLKDKAPPQTGG